MDREEARTPFVPPGIDWSLLGALENGRIGLAVSGGGDSTALAVLFREHAPSTATMLLTVNHGLRPEATEEEAAVQRLAHRLGFGFAAATAEGRPEGNLQAWARSERYRLLAQMAASHGLCAIVTAHTLDDQAETFLLRLRRRSGLRGLAGMRPVSRRAGLTILRPFLQVRREDLRRALTERGLCWHEDPSNDDTRYDRIAVRQMLPTLATIGLDAPALAASATHLAASSDVFERETARHWDRIATIGRSRQVLLHTAAFHALPAEYRRRLLSRAVRIAGGGLYEPRGRTVSTMDTALRAAQRTHGGGTLAIPHGPHILIVREAREIAPVRLPSGKKAPFDNRFLAISAAGTPDCEIRVPARGVAMPAVAHPLVVRSAPCVIVNGVPVAAPTLGIRRVDWPADAVRLIPLASA
ncbi:MAG: tRNA lysidine(34) synthetase TilS [Pseudomonadota bacterium]